MGHSFVDNAYPYKGLDTQNSPVCILFIPTTCSAQQHLLKNWHLVVKLWKIRNCIAELVLNILLQVVILFCFLGACTARSRWVTCRLYTRSVYDEYTCGCKTLLDESYTCWLHFTNFIHDLTGMPSFYRTIQNRLSNNHTEYYGQMCSNDSDEWWVQLMQLVSQHLNLNSSRTVDKRL